MGAQNDTISPRTIQLKPTSRSCCVFFLCFMCLFAVVLACFVVVFACFVFSLCCVFLCLLCSFFFGVCLCLFVCFVFFGVCLPPSFPGQLCFVSCLLCVFLSFCQGSVTASGFFVTIFRNHDKQSSHEVLWPC